MQRAGNSAGALGAFQKAAQADPKDMLAAAMLAKANREQKATEDKVRQERIDNLVGELAESFKSGGAPPVPEDAWTSRPIAISFLDFKSRGAPASREGEDEFFLLQVNSFLQESGRIQIVEREMLDKLLAELKLSTTDLVNPNTALRLGRILSARIIATGSIMRYNKDIRLSMRLTDTETTLMKGAIAATDKDMDALAQATAQKILEKINTGYPIQGKILSLEDDQVLLNIGAETGVQQGMEFKVLEEIQPAKEGGRVRYKPAGSIKIASVEVDAAYATIAPETKDIVKKEMKVQQLLQ